MGDAGWGSYSSNSCSWLSHSGGQAGRCAPMGWHACVPASYLGCIRHARLILRNSTRAGGSGTAQDVQQVLAQQAAAQLEQPLGQLGSLHGCGVRSGAGAAAGGPLWATWPSHAHTHRHLATCPNPRHPNPRNPLDPPPTNTTLRPGALPPGSLAPLPPYTLPQP